MISDTNVIGSAGDAEPREPSRWSSPGRRAALDLLVTLVAAVVLILVNGGRPYSNWFYAVLAVAVVARGFESLRGKPEPKLPRDPPMEKRAAMREAIWKAISTAVWFYAIMVTVFGYVGQWPVALIISGMIGSNFYQWCRGRKPSWKYFAFVTALAIALTAVAAILVKALTR